ncbi:uncharacterized protein LOC114843969 [Betta splendens]|uniref:Uncharacterized protein LOC114843969 n=1 Tax=Betta splendens TaxID=158456 RepID=A0A6P7L135_BETSP|nr:uncharacterized protein LOC114843969 [Betta splendens]
MEDAIFRDSHLYPDLTELETKVGRKTPEGLLRWMRDAATGADRDLGRDVDDGGARSSALNDGVSVKINHLKEELKRLRTADVKILGQLVNVHEGIETMRWLMENRGALASGGSSLTGSVSSLVNVDESWTDPCRETPSPICPQDLTENTERESHRLQLPLSDDGDFNQKSNMSIINHQSEGRPLGSSNSGLSWFMPQSLAQPSANTASDVSGASLPESQTQDPEASPLKSIKSNAKTIKRVLLRSSRVRKEVTARTSSSIFTTESEETKTEHQTHKRFRTSLDNTTSSLEEDWMEDEVTFL